MASVSQFLVNQYHTARPVKSLSNDSYELVQFSESKTYSMLSVVRFTNK